MDKEQIYDEHISPIMKQLIAACQEHGIPMYATCQFQDDAFCVTALHDEGHILLTHLQALGQCAAGDGVNLDKYLNWVAKKARTEGHGSSYLLMAGVPCQPAKVTEPAPALASEPDSPQTAVPS